MISLLCGIETSQINRSKSRWLPGAGGEGNGGVVNQRV